MSSFAICASRTGFYETQSRECLTGEAQVGRSARAWPSRPGLPGCNAKPCPPIGPSPSCVMEMISRATPPSAGSVPWPLVTREEPLKGDVGRGGPYRARRRHPTQATGVSFARWGRPPLRSDQPPWRLSGLPGRWSTVQPSRSCEIRFHEAQRPEGATGATQPVGEPA